MGTIHYLPGHVPPKKPDNSTTADEELNEQIDWLADSGTGEHSYSYAPPGRDWSGVMTLPLSALVDASDVEMLTVGSHVLVADTGLTRAAVVVAVGSDRTVTVDVS